MFCELDKLIYKFIQLFVSTFSIVLLPKTLEEKDLIV